MKILKLNPNKPEKRLLKLAAEVLKNDGIVIYPTDTLYGIAANALSSKAIKKVYKAKGRAFRKPLSIAFHSIEQAKQYVKFDETSLKLAKRFLPGPLTIVLPMKKKLPKQLAYGLKNVGIRIPDNKVVSELIKNLDYPITSTSANKAGGLDPTTADQAISQVGDKVDLILDGGKCKFKKPSTVVEIVGGEIKILREGAIKRKNFK